MVTFTEEIRNGKLYFFVHSVVLVSFREYTIFGIKRFDLIIIANINPKFTIHLETLITTVS